jgi:hypothetical protein
MSIDKFFIDDAEDNVDNGPGANCPDWMKKDYETTPTQKWEQDGKMFYSYRRKKTHAYNVTWVQI